MGTQFASYNQGLTNKLVFENLKHRPIRTILVVLAIGVQVNLMLTLVGMSIGMLSDYQKRSAGVGADVIIRPPNTSVLSAVTPNLKEAMLKYFLDKPEVTDGLGVTVHGMEGFLNSATGVDLQRMQEFTGGFTYLEGGAWKTPDEIIVDEYYAIQRKLHVGSRIQLMNQIWTVAGVVDSGKMGRVFIDIKKLQDLTGNTGKFSFIYLKLKSGVDADQYVAKLREEPFLKEYPIYSMTEFKSLISIDNAPGLRPFLNVIVGLSVVVGFLVVFLSLYTAVLERTREIGILKSLGATPGYVIQLLFRETVLLSLIGGAAGIGMSYGSKYLIMTLVPASLQMQIVMEWWPKATGIAIVASLIGALYPGYKAAKQDAIEALAYE